METYEKKYKEALEKARQLCACPTSKPFISDLQDIFPELKESEDEKIRKAMIKYFTNGKEYLSLTPYSREDYIAWLEKQQKPAEWSKEDEFHFKSIESAIEYCKKEVAENDEAKYLYNEDLNWFKVLKDKVQPQPKQEWSEEDDEKLEWLCRIIHSCKVSKEISLAEESEIGSWVDKWLNYAPQSHWKPSDEQMELIKDIVFKDRQKITRKELAIFHSIYNDLKKL